MMDIIGFNNGVQVKKEVIWIVFRINSYLGGNFVFELSDQKKIKIMIELIFFILYNSSIYFLICEKL